MYHSQQGQYYEAVVQDIDPAVKSLNCCFPEDAGIDEACFSVEYDILVLGEPSWLPVLTS